MHIDIRVYKKMVMIKKKKHQGNQLIEGVLSAGIYLAPVRHIIYLDLETIKLHF